MNVIFDHFLLFYLLFCYISKFIMCIKVEDWLREVYSSHKKPGATNNKPTTYSDVPSFEKNKVTNQILSDLQEINLAADLQAEEEIRLMKILIQEHVAESICIDILFHIIDIFTE